MALTEPTSILLLEDHDLTRQYLADNLAADGYGPIATSTIAQARRAIASDQPALAVLDLGLPDGDGLHLISEIRGDGDRHEGIDPGLPVLVLSGRDSEIDRVRGLRRGADDYLVKPFGYGELRARIDALLRRRADRPGDRRMRVATLEIDPGRHRVTLEGALVQLSRKEFSLLRVLAAEPTRTFSREELMRDVWDFRSPGRTRTLDTHAYRLRRKLGTGRIAFIDNVWGVGYRLWDGVGAG